MVLLNPFSGGYMRTVFTLWPFLNKPGPLQDFITGRGFKIEWLGKYYPSGSKAGAEEKYAALLEHAGEIEFLVPDLGRIDRKFFEAAKKLKLIAAFGVGIDHIDLSAATEHGVLVTNVPGVNAPSVAELALALMLSLARKVAEHHKNLLTGTWKTAVGSQISGKTLGIVGLGNIGQALVRLCSGFNMRVIAANRTPRPEIAQKLGVTLLPLETVLKEADYLSLHVPAGPTSWYFGEKEFALMKPTACIINTARGGILDLDALTKALQEGRLAGAGLDVFPEEPMDLKHPFFSLEQIAVTPHVGGATHEALYGQTVSCFDEYVRFSKKQRSVNARNAEVYALPGWKDFAPAIK
jgi:D-3-phosphoglycerate dehydrogenase